MTTPPWCREKVMVYYCYQKNTGELLSFSLGNQIRLIIEIRPTQQVSLRGGITKKH